MASLPQSKLTIVHVASEIAPIAKVGGLADVVYGLAKATQAAGHQVEVWIPKYDHIQSSQLDNFQRGEKGLFKAQLHGVNLTLIDDSKYFKRGKIYGCNDDIERFAHFAKAVIDGLKEQPPDIIHLHDWPTALIAPLVQALKWKTRVIFTIHNLEYQGRCLPFQIAETGLTTQGMVDPRAPGDINFLMAGVTFSHFVTTVSPTYLKEILTPGKGHGLDDFLQQHRSKMRGILNGLDYSYWDPATDPYLVCPYSKQTLAGKAENKRHLQRRLGLKESDAPLVASITRLVPQKGPDLIEHGLRYTLEQDGQFVLLGSSPIPSMQTHFEQVQAELKGKGAAFCLIYDEPLSHLIYAAADLLLVPSIFEPCGLTQLIALRYGTLPVARATGGLRDTVFDCDNGFTFDYPDNKGVEGALGRAFRIYRENPKQWKELMHHGMDQDFSWKHSAQEYLSLYRQ